MRRSPREAAGRPEEWSGAGEGAAEGGLTGVPQAVEWSVLVERMFGAAEASSLTIGYSDNLCGCSGVVGTIPRDIDEHFGDEEFVEQGTRRSLRRSARFELKSLILAQIERWRHA